MIKFSSIRSQTNDIRVVSCSYQSVRIRIALSDMLNQRSKQMSHMNHLINCSVRVEIIDHLYKSKSYLTDFQRSIFIVKSMLIRYLSTEVAAADQSKQRASISHGGR